MYLFIYSFIHSFIHKECPTGRETEPHPTCCTVCILRSTSYQMRIYTGST